MISKMWCTVSLCAVLFLTAASFLRPNISSAASTLSETSSHKDPHRSTRTTASAIADARQKANQAYKRGDYAGAFHWDLWAAEREDARSQFNLGFLYQSGQGVRRDYTAAMKWYRKAAKQGFAPAQRKIGLLYERGQGVSLDRVQAAAWFRKAAKQGDADGQYDLGLAYHLGQGVRRDYTAAMKWYRKAAKQGLANAQSNIGILYDDGLGVPVDHAQAAGWYRKAAKQGNAHAQYNLGMLYQKGQGVRRDCVIAMKWYRKAAKHGDHVANKALTDLQRDCGPVAAKGVSVVPGAIICPDYHTVQIMFDWYVQHWTEVQQDIFTGGQSQLIRGQPVPIPQFRRYGCALLPPGTRMNLEGRNLVPIVSAKLHSGKIIQGVTLPSMIQR